jgi:hypothetical protein
MRVLQRSPIDVPDTVQFAAGMAIMGSVFVVVQLLLFIEELGDTVRHAVRDPFAALPRSAAGSR